MDMSAINQQLILLAEWLGVSPVFLSYAFSVFSGLVLLCGLLWWLGQRRTRALKQHIERLQHDFSVSHNSAIGMGQKILALEKQLLKDSTRKNTMNAHNNLEQYAENVDNTKYQPKQASVKSTAKLSVVSNNVSLENLQNAAEDDPDQDAAYALSKQLLAQGHTIEEVINRSGLSYSEVSLMKSLSK